MSTNWVTPVGQDLKKVLSIDVWNASNQNVGEDVTSNQTYDPNADNRADELVGKAIDQIRAAIRIAGSIPLSVTADSVPPEAARYVLDIAAYQLVVSTPGLKMLIITDHGVSSPFAVFYKEAMDWVEKVTMGRAVTPPTDPCGADWTNVVGTAINAVPSTAVYDSNGNYYLSVNLGYVYKFIKGANDTGINVLGTLLTDSNSTFVSAGVQATLTGTAGTAVTAQLLFDNPPIPGMIRYGGTTAANDVDMTTWDAPQPAAFDTTDLGTP